MKVQYLLQKFTSCCIAQDLRMLHIKMFINNAVQNIIQTNKNGEFAGHVQAKQATNSLTSVWYSKWTHSSISRASLLFTFRDPQKDRVPPSDFLSRPGPQRYKFRILIHRCDTFAD